jgi:hypothetical protein
VWRRDGGSIVESTSSPRINTSLQDAVFMISTGYFRARLDVKPDE